MSIQLALDKVSIELGGQRIIDDVSFSLLEGKISCLLGPSGCGKTTLLRAIAGFEQPTNGEIQLRNQLVANHRTNIAPERRKIGMVFQDLALFPHLSIEGNIAFGMRGRKNREINERVSELLELVGLSHLRHKHPHQLSGGQQQRIALIRAMAPRPDLILLDEPFSSQDTERREQLAREVRNILHKDNITALLVTHDQYEAFAMADHIGVIHEGRLLQWDTPFNLYHEPICRTVANFIGQGVLIQSTVVGSDELETPLGRINGEFSQQLPHGTEVDLLVRPDDIAHDDHSDHLAVVTEKAFRGAQHLYTLKVSDGIQVLCLASSHHNHQINEKIGIKLELDHLVVFPHNT